MVLEHEARLLERALVRARLCGRMGQTQEGSRWQLYIAPHPAGVPNQTDALGGRSLPSGCTTHSRRPAASRTLDLCNRTVRFGPYRAGVRRYLMGMAIIMRKDFCSDADGSWREDPHGR